MNETYTYILSGIAIIIVLFIASKLSRSIKKDDERRARREHILPGPPLSNRKQKYTLKSRM